MLIIHNVFEKRHADYLSDFLALCSHDPKLYHYKSTVVVFTTSISLFSQALLKLVYSIIIPPSTEKERREFINERVFEIKNALIERGMQLDINISEDVISASAGLNLHEIETATLESFFQHREIKAEIYTQYKIKILRDIGLEYIKPVRGFETVGGYDYLKNYIRNRIIKILRNPEIARYYGLSVPKGILLYGFWGCGKTFLAKALAKEVGLAMVSLNPADLFRGIVGESEQRVRQIRNILESMAPIIMFIDEFDQLTMKREMVFAGDSGVSRRISNMLLEWFGDEARRTFIIGATNFVDQIDPAFLRAGRLDEVIPVFLPDYEARKEIFEVHTQIIRKIPLNGGIDYDILAEKTYLFTGAEIEKVVIESSSLAMEKEKKHVTMDEFMEAINSIQFNVNTREQYLKNMVNQLNKLENVNKHLLREALQGWKEGEREETCYYG